MDTQAHVRSATPTDLPSVLEVQHDAFTRVSCELDIEPGLLPPLTETLSDLETLIESGTRFFVALIGERVVGSVRATLRDRSVEVGRLVVATGHTRQGIATALMDAVEGSFPEADRFILFTGIDATAPLRLYESRGYVRTRLEVTPATTLVWLEKTVR